MSIPVWFNARSTWDQGLIDAAVSGTLWPLPVSFEVVAEPQPNGVMVVHGEVAQKVEPPRPPAGTVLVHASDEHLGWDSARYRSDRCKVWLMHDDPMRPRGCDRRIVPGWPPGTREGLGPFPRPALTERRLWGFAGQVQNDSRRSFVRAMRGRSDGDMRLSQGFAQGMPRDEYLRWLTSIAIAPSPAGNVNPEGFRLYEALEAGCLPIAQRSFPDWSTGVEWWPWTLGEAPPFPILDSWAQLAPILNQYRGEPTALVRDAIRAGAWWAGHKRRLALNLVDDLEALGASVQAPPVTVIVSSSPVPSHPSTAMIEETIRRVRAYPEFTNAEIIICVDGVSEADNARRADYAEYTRRLVDLCNGHPDFGGCLPLIFETHQHQASMTRRALELVRTPLIFFVEHDTWPYGEIDFAGMLRVLTETDFANVLRLHVFHEVLPVHVPLYTDGQVNVVCDVPLIRTTDWSQRPHLARTQWYRDMLERYVPQGWNGWIEHAWHGPVCAAAWEEFKVAIYAPQGNMTRSGHSDGRRLGATDAK